MKKYVVTVLIALTLVAGVVPSRAYAADYDSPLQVANSFLTAIKTSLLETKDWIFDTLAWQVASLAIESMTRSIVNWINSGFEGSPAFVTNLQQDLRGIGDAVAARFFEELAMQDIATTPFQDRVLDTVRLGYYLHTSPESFYTRYPYTLNQVSPDARAFLEGDFSQGGWNAWFSTVLNPQNNPYGAEMLADAALQDAVEGATGDRLEELSWNRGFISWRGECQDAPATGGGTNTGTGGSNSPVNTGGENNCLSYEIRTPGTVIMESLNRVEGVPFDRLVSADEFNEIIGALLNQLALQVIGGGDGGGVRGLSQPSTSGGGTFFDRTEGSGSTTSIGNTFLGTITRQREKLETFQASWERIRTAAESARNRCGTGGEPDPQEVLERASLMLVKAGDALAALTALQTEIEAALAAGGNQSETLLEISERYNEIINSPSFPTAEEMSEAMVSSQDTGTTEPGSLYSQLMRRSSGSCSSSDN
ncbi:MAG TPA: hypothetical protein PK609_00805 [Candidatus Paceibacterota bacterium]|nr:hypothetical protein [Candidatus Paceibacterota bacterium]